MNIFGVGGAELVLILLIMLVVAGPKRMIHWAYILGQYVGKFRAMWSEVVDVVQKEFDEAGVDVKLPKEPPTRQNINQWAASSLKPISKPIESTWQSIDQDLKADLEGRPPAKPVQPPVAKAPSAGKGVAAAKTAAADKASVNGSLGTWGGANKASTSDAPAAKDSLGTWSQPDAKQERPS